MAMAWADEIIVGPPVYCSIICSRAERGDLWIVTCNKYGFDDDAHAQVVDLAKKQSIYFGGDNKSEYFNKITIT